MSNKVPQIRFTGYSDPWEERKLGDYIIQYSEKTKQNNQYPVFTSSRNGLFFQKDYYKGNQIASEDNTGYNIVPRGYFTYRHMSDDLIFKFNINDLADYGIVSTLYPVFTTNEQLDSKYLQYQLNEGSEFRRFSLLQKQGGSRTYMYLNKLQNMILTIPKLEEQQRIGSFFKQLDDTIALHQRKLELLKEQKKGYLQKMFPKNGAKVPELRFSGFADDWEERKLKDIAQFNPKTVLPDEFEYVDLESVVGTEMISHRTESKDQAPSRAQRLAQKGDVFYQTVRPYQMNNYLYDLPYDNYVFSTGYAQMRPNIDSYFLLNSVQNKQFVQHVLDRSTGTSYPAINSSDLSNIGIHVPSKLSEQQKIGAFFQSMDDTIALHQRKLELLKEQKKGFLQKMFV